MSGENISFDPIEIKQYDHKNKKKQARLESQIYF